MALRVITLSYYHPMARFFCAIEDQWKKLDENVEFLHLAVFPSAFLYFLVHGRKVKSPTWAGLFSKEVSSELIDGDALERMISFHSADPAIDDSGIAELQLHAKRVFFRTLKAVEDFSPDVAIVSGDTRLPAEALILALHKTQASLWFFEQGPYRTTIIDPAGVNANCSFRESLKTLQFSPSEPGLDLGNQVKRWNNKLYTLFDKFFAWQGALTGLIPPDVRGYKLRSFDKKLYAGLVKSVPREWSPKCTVLVALQVPEDANNVYHNPLKLDDSTLIEMVVASLPQGWNVIVREHPLYRRKYSDRFYSLVGSLGNLCLSGASLTSDLQAAEATVTINSMTGLDAFAVGHKVAVLGDAFYDQLPGIQKITTQRELRDFFLEVVVSADVQSRSALLRRFKDSYLISGHFTDVDLSFARRIVEKVMP